MTLEDPKDLLVDAYAEYHRLERVLSEMAETDTHYVIWPGADAVHYVQGGNSRAWCGIEIGERARLADDWPGRLPSHCVDCAINVLEAVPQ